MNVDEITSRVNEQSLEAVTGTSVNKHDEEPTEFVVETEIDPEWGLPASIYQETVRNGLVIADYRPITTGTEIWFVDAAEWAEHTK